MARSPGAVKRPSRLGPADLVRRGIVQVLEGRHCFPHLSCRGEPPCRAASRDAPGGSELRGDLRTQSTPLFPRLKLRRRVKAGLLSGGEQQMVAIGRALMSRPTLILLDEPSMGLAPMIVEEIFRHHPAAQRTEEGVTFLLAEQNAHLVLRHAHHGVVLENGRVVASAPAVRTSGARRRQRLLPRWQRLGAALRLSTHHARGRNANDTDQTWPGARAPRPATSQPRGRAIGRMFHTSFGTAQRSAIATATLPFDEFARAQAGGLRSPQGAGGTGWRTVRRFPSSSPCSSSFRKRSPI